MSQIIQIPDWLGAAIVSVAIAALGFVAKQIIEWFSAVRESRTTKRAKLVELQSLLRASWVSFSIQNSHASSLMAMIRENHPSHFSDGEGYERIFSKTFNDLTHNERELHDIIRSMTINALRPVNEWLLEWLKHDEHFKA